MRPVSLGGKNLDLAAWIELSRIGSRASLDRTVPGKVQASRRVVEQALLEKRTVYGVNTGFGKLASVPIPESKLTSLQHNLLLSHACGVGEPLAVEVSRLALALRLHALTQGCSGVRLELCETMLALFNADLVPVIPSQGSVGASGDLAPLAHMALPLIGRGEVHAGKGRISGRSAMRRIGLPS